jgi:hypothetical protein
METISVYAMPGIARDRIKQDTTLEKIGLMVAYYYNINVDKIQVKTQQRQSVLPRQICMYFSLQLTKHSLSEIGEYFAGRDHATVLHAKKTINNLVETNRNIREEIKDIEFLILRGKHRKKPDPVICDATDNVEKLFQELDVQKKNNSIYAQILNERIREKNEKLLLAQLDK